MIGVLMDFDMDLTPTSFAGLYGSTAASEPSSDVVNANGVASDGITDDTDGGRDAYFGTDGINDFSCGLIESGPNEGDNDGPCDTQFETASVSSFLGDPVPEPATIAMMGLGLGLMGFIGRRTRRRQAV